MEPVSSDQGVDAELAEDVGRPQEEDLVRVDRLLRQRVDSQMERAYELGKAHLACRPGCHECCVGPFAINALEGWRLRRGLAELGRRDVASARAILARAEAARQVLRPGFPGDPILGRLDDCESEDCESEDGRPEDVDSGGLDSTDDESIEKFLNQHAELPCPVLDPVSGHCQLYAHRPLTCRSYGPPIRIGGESMSPCRLCFETVDEEQLDVFRIDLDSEGLEESILDALAHGLGEEGMTLIAFALQAEPEGWPGEQKEGDPTVRAGCKKRPEVLG